MPSIPGLRSPYGRVGRLVYFGRMLDKIRLDDCGKLPLEFQVNLGESNPNHFDARCCRFLGVPYARLAAQVHTGATDDEALLWAHTEGTARSDEECTQWNRFAIKLGWRDERSAALRERIGEYGLSGKPIETFFDLFDFDEGRDPLQRRAWELTNPQVLLIMGVSGSGKTTIGQKLAEALGWKFNDADDFHSAANVAKMTAGIPLTDDDRQPWLLAIREHILTCLRNGESAVVTCSALKESYRKLLISEPSKVHVIFLNGSRELLLARMKGRAGHFMKPEMLDSQLAALEEPKDAFAVDIADSPEIIVAKIRRAHGI